MTKLEGTQLLKLLQQTLSKHQVAYDDIVEAFGQVPAAMRRAQGHRFTMAEHVRGLILAQLSN